MVINIDWLSFSVLLAMDDEEVATGARLLCPLGYSLIELGGTNIYKRRVMVYNEYGEKLLTLLLEPHSKILDPKSMFVEVANKWLYFDLSWVLPLLDRIHLYSFQSLSRLDVCCDFNPDIHQVHVIECLEDNSMYVSGKREGVMFYDFGLNNNGMQVTRAARCLSWGSKNSNFHWKLYNKSLEVYEVDSSGRKWCNKSYIEAQWKEAGLDCDNVWRLEWSVMGAAKFEWRGMKLGFDFVLRRDWIEDLYRDMVGTRFVIRANQGHKCRKWDEVVELLDLGEKHHFRVRQRVAGVEQRHTDHAATMRAAIAQLERPETRCNVMMKGCWEQALRGTVEAGKLEAYFYRQYGMGLDDWIERYEKEE